jgi:signal transduction histidine kinase
LIINNNSFRTVEDELEERLRQSQKLEGIGHLAGGIAHEFNNILAAMTMNLNLVQMSSLEAEARELLSEIEKLSRKAAALIKQLLAFSRQSMLQPQHVDVVAVVSRQCTMLERLLGERITLEFSSAPTLPWVNADKSMIEQVLLNLCLNARDAMKNGGLLRLRLEEAEVGAEQAMVRGEAQPGRYVCLSVTDTGCGMDERALKRLFEPFFTTKEVGQGTGLGLATVRGIVQQHHGWVEVESCVGKGSIFRVYLPAVARPAVAPAAPEQEASGSGKGAQK